MKIQKLTQKTAISTVVHGLSLGAGAMLSKGAMSLLPANYQTSTYKGGVALLAFLASAIIKGETEFDKSIQAAFIGMGVEQSVQALSAELGKTLNVDPNATGGTKFLQASLGLGNGAAEPYQSLGEPISFKDWNLHKEEEPITRSINVGSMSA